VQEDVAAWQTWMKVFADLQARECRDVLIAVTDGLTGMGEALEAVYPRTTWQPASHTKKLTVPGTRAGRTASSRLDAGAHRLQSDRSHNPISNPQ